MNPSDDELTRWTRAWRGDEERLPPSVELALYRIAQEAVTNVVRHARATTLTLALERVWNLVILSVADDGIGMDLTNVHSSEHLGLAGMRERSRLVGAAFSVESSPGLGTKIVVAIPVSVRSAARHQESEQEA